MNQQRNIPRSILSELTEKYLFVTLHIVFENLSYIDMCSTLALSRNVRQQLFSYGAGSYQYRWNILRLFLSKDVKPYQELLKLKVLSQEDLDAIEPEHRKNRAIYIFQALTARLITPKELLSTHLMIAVLLTEAGLKALQQKLFTPEDIYNIKLYAMRGYNGNDDEYIDFLIKAQQLLANLFTPVGLIAMKRGFIIPRKDIWLDILPGPGSMYGEARKRLRQTRRESTGSVRVSDRELSSQLLSQYLVCSFYPALVSLTDEIDLFCELRFGWRVATIFQTVMACAVLTVFLMALRDSEWSVTDLMADVLGDTSILNALHNIQSGGIHQADYECVGQHWDIEYSLFSNAKSNTTQIGELFSDPESAAECAS